MPKKGSLLEMAQVRKIEKIENPNRFYAVPVLGFLIKLIFIIPVGIELLFLAIGYFVVSFINSLIVLFTGKYWHFAYQWGLGIIQLTIKSHFYFYGLTDKYPGFNLEINDHYQVGIAYPLDLCQLVPHNS